MKKIFSILVAAICLTVCAFSFTACGDKTPEHTTHNWSATYTEDGDRHYQTCDGCDEKKYSNHDYGTSGVCVCGKHKPETPVAVTGVSLNKTQITLEVGGTETLIATVSPENATDKTVTWTVAPAGVVSVENGVITAIKDGTAVITAKTANGKTATCTVTVNAAVIPVESVTLDKTEITLEIDGTETLTATVSPENATDKTVTWTSDKENIVTVDGTGKVTAVAAGTAVITATAANNKTTTCSVTVNAPLTNAQVLQFLNDNVLMKAARSIYAESGWDINESNIKNATWFVIKEGNNVKGANLVFTYERRINGHYINLCKVDFDKSLTPQNIKNGEIGIPTYTNLYQNIINPTIQDLHTALTNAICNKLFGEKQNATRYIIDNGLVSADPQLKGDGSTFTVIEITDTVIQEKSLKISYANTDDGLITNLNDTTKYYTYGNEKNVAITGDKLENNNEPFFGNAD